MSYIVLARKYRPQSFAEVYAQDHVTEILQSAIESNRIAHAYLFTGPRGVGKTSMARIMAKSLNCENGPTKQPCNICSNCQEITLGTSPDVIEIDGASNTSVDDVRDLQRELLYAATSSKFKIYIIDEVHMLSKSAFNALLKTLEEPPENVVFIFATTEPHKVLPTIISRCQRYDFKRIPIDSIVKRLKDLSEIEGIRIDTESLYLIARKADGGMRDALSLMDQAISYCINEISIDKVRQIFGLIPNQVYQHFMTMIDQGDARGLINELHLVFEQGTDLQEFISNMLEFIRMLILRKLGVQIMDINPEELSLFDELGILFNQNKLLYMLSFLIAARNDMRSSPNPYLILEALMIKLCKMDEMEDVAKLLSGGNLQAKTAVQASDPQNPKPQAQYQNSPSQPHRHSASQPQAEPETPKQAFNSENLNTLWPRIIARAKKIGNMCSLALDSSKERTVNGKQLLLTLDSQTNFNMLKTNQDKLQETISELFHENIQISLKLLETEPPTKVHINRRTLEDIKKESPELARFIETTDSVLSQ
jgi:DNA polymerase-3 subunit gamma/tau